MSHLELIIGPMFSGKSTELIRKIRLLKTINKKVLVIKPKIDNRYTEDNKIISHNFESCECISLNTLSDISLWDIVDKYDTVVIDEGQFFPDLKKCVLHWLNTSTLTIIIGSLDGDYNRNPIGEVLELIPYADECTKLTSLCSICNDGTKAPFTKRIANSNEQILVGGKESYIPVCSTHYHNPKKYDNKNNIGHIPIGTDSEHSHKLNRYTNPDNIGYIPIAIGTDSEHSHKPNQYPKPRSIGHMNLFI